MKFTYLKSLLVCLFVLSAQTGFAEKKLPDEDFQAFLKNSKVAPGNLAKDQELIRKLSNPQLKEMVESFNIGHYGFLHPMRIKGEELPALLGRKFEELSVMAVWDGKLKPIPFQFDEFDKKNRYIYIPDVNKSRIDGTYLELDKNDLLIFMYRDASEKRLNKETMSLGEGKILKELEIKDSHGNVRYAYVVENNSERSDADYISTDIDKSKIVSSYYHIEYNPKNFLDFKDVRPYVGTAADQRVIDNIYFELGANLSRFLRVGLNSAKNVRIKILGVKDGPVRATAFIRIGIVFRGIRVFSMNSEVSFYEQGMVMPNRTEVGKGALFVKLFKDPEIVMYADMNGLEGGKVSAQAFKNSEGKRLYGFIDGKMDEEELEAVDAGLPGDWTWIESGLGWDIFMSFKLPMEHLEGMTMKVYYEDDKNATTDFETFPGAGPKIGMVLNGLPNDMKKIETLDMEYAFWFPDTVGQDGPEAFHQEERNPPKVNVISFE
jgi:hypothetical protein